MDGALLIDKPAGPTSHDIVAIVRRALNTPRVGHTGTLDPLATGLLVLLVGRATRLAQFLATDEKEYLADIQLGISTPTYDSESADVSSIEEARRSISVTCDQIRAVLPDFLGTFSQLPPPFSAKKVDGVRAYKKARKNEPIGLKAMDVTVRQLALLDTRTEQSGTQDRGTQDRGTRDQGLIRLRIVCSAGFYVRSLAHDIGQTLGCGAHLAALRRTRAGRFTAAKALTLDVLARNPTEAADNLIPLNTLLDDLPAVTLTEEGARRAGHGNPIGSGHVLEVVPGSETHARVRLLASSGTLLAVAERRAGGLLHPVVVLG
jgi:tRNA pseudouridine55 synthase